MAGDDAVARLMMPLDRCSSSRRRRVIIVMGASNSDEVTTETAEVTAVGGNRR